MRATLVSALILTAVSGSAHAADEGFAAAARLCESLFESGALRDAESEAALFRTGGFLNAGMTISGPDVSHSYTRSGRPMDGAMISVNRSADLADTSCTVMWLESIEGGQSLIAARTAQAAWRADGTQDDEMGGEGRVFRRGLADGRPLQNIIWGDPDAAMPMSVASYQIESAN